MTHRQKMFCYEYAQSGNATQSAIKAGYAEKTARSQGQRLLTKVDIQNELQRLADEMASSKIATAKEMQELLTSIIRSEETEEVVVVEGCGDGISQATVVDKRPSARDKIKAVETLAKMQGVLDNKTALNICIPVFGGEDNLEE